MTRMDEAVDQVLIRTAILPNKPVELFNAMVKCFDYNATRTKPMHDEDKLGFSLKYGVDVYKNAGGVIFPDSDFITLAISPQVRSAIIGNRPSSIDEFIEEQLSGAEHHRDKVTIGYMFPNPAHLKRMLDSVTAAILPRRTPVTGIYESPVVVSVAHETKKRIGLMKSQLHALVGVNPVDLAWEAKRISSELLAKSPRAVCVMLDRYIQYCYVPLLSEPR